MSLLSAWGAITDGGLMDCRYQPPPPPPPPDPIRYGSVLAGQALYSSVLAIVYQDDQRVGLLNFDPCAAGTSLRLHPRLRPPQKVRPGIHDCRLFTLGLSLAAKHQQGLIAHALQGCDSCGLHLRLEIHPVSFCIDFLTARHTVQEIMPLHMLCLHVLLGIMLASHWLCLNIHSYPIPAFMTWDSKVSLVVHLCSCRQWTAAIAARSRGEAATAAQAWLAGLAWTPISTMSMNSAMNESGDERGRHEVLLILQGSVWQGQLHAARAFLQALL